MNVTRHDAPSVDAEHPWIGLASFTESSRGYFHGREDEITELCRRIQRKPLTVLFGKSGLGKTSILQAGVVPRLRDQGYCPVYLRIDYAESAPSAAEQIKQAIVKAAEQSGRWSREGVADEGESLWAFLHHRDDVLLDADGRPLLPLLIFDQFEEIFTLAQADEQGRERAASFTADLAELVENRPPAALEALLEDDDQAYERYDLARADYRVVISLREDYLAHLEGLKAAMPSITQNRLRLAPMTGAQALSAVIEPGRRLVNDEVAAAIVRFVAGGAEVAHAEVEPSLLSLICRELNDQRIALGRPEIGADLLAGSHTSILGEFYERSVADQPAGVRAFIEDHLLTDSGYRENVAEERVRSEFAAAGAAPDTLALLVNRRLLRIEERLDLRRVELTHDVLCAVLRASRDARREREALEASERLVLEQAEAARLAQRALRRARVVSSVCILLAVGAVAASGFAVVNSRRAQQAEVEARATRTRAEQLMGYLQNNLTNELAPIARSDLTKGFNDRVAAYYDNLPADQRTAASERNRAMALVRQSHSLDDESRLAEAMSKIDAALVILEPRAAGGRASELDRSDLASALAEKADQIMDASGDRAEALTLFRRARALLQVSDASALGSNELRMTYAKVMTLMCTAEVHGNVQERAEAGSVCSAARKMLMDLGAMDLTDPITSDRYVSVSWAISSLLVGEGRSQQALVDAAAAVQLGRRLVNRYPNYSSAQLMLGLVEGDMGDARLDRLELSQAVQDYGDALTDFTRLATADGTKIYAKENIATTQASLAALALERGHPELAVIRFREAGAAFDLIPKTGSFLLESTANRGAAVLVEADLGDSAATSAALGEEKRDLEAFMRTSTQPGQATIDLAECRSDVMQAELSWFLRDGARARQIALARLSRIEASHAKEDDLDHASCRSKLSWVVARVLYEASDAAGAEASLRTAIAVFNQQADRSNASRRYAAELATWLALAQVRQGRVSEARAGLVPVVAFERALAKSSSESARQHLELASALYVQALTETGSARQALLSEAKALVDGLPAPMRALHSVQMWQGWIMASRDSAYHRDQTSSSTALPARNAAVAIVPPQALIAGGARS